MNEALSGTSNQLPRPHHEIPCKALGLSDYVDVDATTQSRPKRARPEQSQLLPLLTCSCRDSSVVVVVAAFVDNTLNSICIFSCPMKRTPHTRSTQTFRRARTHSLSLSLSFDSGPVQINGFLPALLATCKPEQHEEEELKQEQVNEKELEQQSEQEEPRQLTEMCR